ncbi:MAG: TldD/PmbA family protein [Leptospiraceae bacterium]|nr:TldD/PmbA family protein [Leptospiraceae bacterium]
MNQVLAQKILQLGLGVGADFTEIFVEETRHSSVSFSDKKVETATAGIEFGIGIRLIFGTEVLYASTSKEEEDHLIQLVRDLAKTRNDNKKINTMSPIVLNIANPKSTHSILKDPRKIPQREKLNLLKEADRVARSFSGEVSQVVARAFDSVSNISIYNSEGLELNDHRVLSRFTLGVTATNGKEVYTGSEAPGAQQGFEFFESLDVGKYATQAAERAILMLNAGYITGKKMPVIMGNGFGGVIFHEACGHPLETEAIRKKSSPFVGKLGEKIAHESVTAIDDGTIANSWGSINVDDEGMLPEKTVLIENGILKNYLSDRIGSQEVGVRRTGSARRESYIYSPVSRMRNTYIDNGNSSVEEMLYSVEEGLYAKKMGGGSVNPATGEFNFSVEEGYIIRKGKIAEPVRGATLIGKGHEILPKISMVANDLEITAGMCGASSGSVPVTVGQPTLKVDEILVGGR